MKVEAQRPYATIPAGAGVAQALPVLLAIASVPTITTDIYTTCVGPLIASSCAFCAVQRLLFRDRDYRLWWVAPAVLVPLHVAGALLAGVYSGGQLG